MKAFSAGNPCGPATGVESFRTGTETGTVSVNEIVEVNEWRVSPNPLKSNQILNVEINAESNFDADINIFTTSGKLIQSHNHTFGTGTSHYEINVDGLSMGMYLLFIKSESGVLTEKIVVTK